MQGCPLSIILYAYYNADLIDSVAMVKTDVFQMNWIMSQINHENICGDRMHQKLRGCILAQKNWTAISYTMEQSWNLTKFETKLMTNSFGKKYNPSAFDVFYLHKYPHDLS